MKVILILNVKITFLHTVYLQNPLGVYLLTSKNIFYILFIYLFLNTCNLF